MPHINGGPCDTTHPMWRHRGTARPNPPPPPWLGKLQYPCRLGPPDVHNCSSVGEEIAYIVCHGEMYFSGWTVFPLLACSQVLLLPPGVRRQHPSVISTL